MTATLREYPDGRLDTDNAAIYLGLSPKTLAAWRCDGVGPAFVKCGRRVFYFRNVLDEWLQKGTASSTAQARLLRQQQEKAVAND